MNRPELDPLEPATEEKQYDLGGIVDPIQLATQALAKLRAANLSGVILGERKVAIREHKTATTRPMNVIDIDEIRASRSAHAGTVEQEIKTEDEVDHEEIRQEIADLPKSADRKYQPNAFADNDKQFTPKQMELFSKHYHLPERIARQITYNTEEYEEAVAAGYLGLVKAVKRYDPAKVSERATEGVGYIYTTIKGEILRGIRDRNHTRAIDEEGRRIYKPSILTNSAVSIYEPLGDEGDRTLEDTLGSNGPDIGEYIGEKIANHDLAKAILNIISDYPEREREIFTRYTSLGQTQQQIARTIGLSQMHVSRLMTRMVNDVMEKLGLQDDYEIYFSKRRRSKQAPEVRGDYLSHLDSDDLELFEL
jgi:RNA polymerase sigma-B factor